MYEPIPTLIATEVQTADEGFEEAAAYVLEAWGKAVQGIIETGQRLIEKKAEKGHGWWLTFVEHHLPFSERTTQMLMGIGRHSAISNPQHVADLPASWGTLAELARLPPAEVETAITEGRITADMSRADAEELTGPTKPHVSQNSGENEWYTPAPFIAAARLVLGTIDIDPASSLIANATVQADTFYTAETNGLEQQWNGTVWMNPPYAKGLIENFAAKLLEELDAGRCTAAITLTNNSTDTRWFQGLAASAAAVCFPAGRVKFLEPDGTEGKPLQGQALLYFGNDPDGFTEAFAEFGFVR